MVDGMNFLHQYLFVKFISGAQISPSSLSERDDVDKIFSSQP
jgi:hypothetical protein